MQLPGRYYRLGARDPGSADADVKRLETPAESVRAHGGSRDTAGVCILA